jgi:hypothetical protein
MAEQHLDVPPVQPAIGIPAPAFVSEVMPMQIAVPLPLLDP